MFNKEILFETTTKINFQKLISPKFLKGYKLKGQSFERIKELQLKYYLNLLLKVNFSKNHNYHIIDLELKSNVAFKYTGLSFKTIAKIIPLMTNSKVEFNKISIEKMQEKGF